MPPKAKTVEPTEVVQEITELEKFEPTRVDGVRAGANGFPILMMKALPAESMLNGQGFQDVKSQAYAAMHQAIDDDELRSLLMGLPPEATAGDGWAWYDQAADLVKAALAAPQTKPEDLLKAIGADGQVDETPDIEGGQQAI